MRLTCFYGSAALGIVTSVVGMLLWFCPVTAGADAPSAISFDPSAAATLGGQLKITADSRMETINVFVSRCEATAARALNEVCWVTSRACDPEPAAKEARA